MKRYNITVNGTTYAVDVEEAGAGQAPSVSVPAAQVAAPPAPAVQAAVQPVPAPTPAPAVTPSAGAQSVNSPMPGTILDIRVGVGQAVKQGDVLLILEAMKMENEIMAPGAGTVDVIAVTKGASVNSGDLLITLK